MARMILGIKFYNPDEAAKLLNMSKESVWGYLRQKRLIGRKSGRTWLISEPKLKEFAMGDDIGLAREQVREEIANLKNVLDTFLKKGDITETYYEEALSRLDSVLPGNGRG